MADLRVGDTAASHVESAGAAVADVKVVAIRPSAARDRRRAAAADAVKAEIAAGVCDAASSHVESADAGVADREFAAIGPRATRHRGRAGAAATTAEIAGRVGDAAAGYVQRAGAVSADVKVVAIRPRAARHRGRADACGIAAEIAAGVCDAASSHVESAGAAVADDDVPGSRKNPHCATRHGGGHVQHDGARVGRRAGQVERSCVRQRERACAREHIADREGVAGRLIELQRAVVGDVSRDSRAVVQEHRVSGNDRAAGVGVRTAATAISGG